MLPALTPLRIYCLSAAALGALGAGVCHRFDIAALCCVPLALLLSDEWNAASLAWGLLLCAASLFWLRDLAPQQTIFLGFLAALAVADARTGYLRHIVTIPLLIAMAVYGVIALGWSAAIAATLGANVFLAFYLWKRPSPLYVAFCVSAVGLLVALLLHAPWCWPLLAIWAALLVASLRRTDHDTTPIGGGDVLLATGVGFAFGYPQTLDILLAALFAAALISLSFRARHLRLGPAFWIGMMGGLWWAQIHTV